MVHEDVAAFRGQGTPVRDRRGRATTHERVQITKNGGDYVVLMAAADLESIEATLEMLGDPKAQQRVIRSEEDLMEGDVLDEAEVRALLAAPGANPSE